MPNRQPRPRSTPPVADPDPAAVSLRARRLERDLFAAVHGASARPLSAWMRDVLRWDRRNAGSLPAVLVIGGLPVVDAVLAELTRYRAAIADAAQHAPAVRPAVVGHIGPHGATRSPSTPPKAA